MSPMGSRTSPTPADAPYPSLGFSVMKAASAASKLLGTGNLTRYPWFTPRSRNFRD